MLTTRYGQTMNLSLFAAEDFKLTEGDTYSVLINSQDQQALLRNPHCTKKLLNDGKTRLVPSAPTHNYLLQFADAFFNDGAPRRPHVSKVHGHWNLYWLPEMQTIVNSNPQVRSGVYQPGQLIDSHVLTMLPPPPLSQDLHSAPPALRQVPAAKQS
jgi:hypothetical protein